MDYDIQITIKKDLFVLTHQFDGALERKSKDL